jgi:DNA-binding winged helix-turn-helix (wHTH) protein
MQIGRAHVDLARFQVACDGQTLRLSAQEVALLRVFQQCGAPLEDGRLQATVDRERLFRDGLGYRSASGSRALDYAIRRLRTKLGDDTAGRAALETLRGAGYRLTWAPGLPGRPSGPVLIGREPELKDLERLLQDADFVTILGPPGAGKSALVRRWLVDREGTAWLGPTAADPGAALIVIDGADTALSAARALVDAVRARGGRVLCTSRRRLGLPDERILDLGPLPRSAARELLRLHAHRAGAPAPEGPALDALCEACDDLPLALVLVAPRLRSLPPERLLRRLLASPTSAPALDAAVATAWAGLGPAARAALVRLAEAPGEASLDELEARLAAEDRDELELLETIEELVEHSLLTVRPGPAGLRYRLLRPLAQAARQLSLKTAH